MNKIRQFQIFFILLFVLAVTEGAKAQAVAAFSEAEVAKADAVETQQWRFRTAGGTYEIDKSGRGSRLGRQDPAPRFQLKLQRDENLTRVYFAEFKTDLLMLCESELGDGGAGFITRLDATTLKPKWKRHIPAFNVAPGLIEGNFAYLGAIGFAAKIDLNTGAYRWKHEDFYRTYKESGAFGGFDALEIEGVEVVYTENDIIARRTNVIKFNKETGKVIKVVVD